MALDFIALVRAEIFLQPFNSCCFRIGVPSSRSSVGNKGSSPAEAVRTTLNGSIKSVPRIIGLIGE
jgi:hypothetical protein